MVFIVLAKFNLRNAVVGLLGTEHLDVVANLYVGGLVAVDVDGVGAVPDDYALGGLCNGGGLKGFDLGSIGHSNDIRDFSTGGRNTYLGDGNGLEGAGGLDCNGGGALCGVVVGIGMEDVCTLVANACDLEPLGVAGHKERRDLGIDNQVEGGVNGRELCEIEGFHVDEGLLNCDD